MLFGKGNWSIFGVEPKSLLQFNITLQTPANLFGVSQLKASIITKFQDRATVGINPFATPRKDEDLKDVNIIAELAKALAEDRPEDYISPLSPDVLQDFYGGTPSSYRIGQDDQSDYYGFWVVFNDFEDLTDTASKKEQASYLAVSRPYKYLNNDEKKGVDAQIKATTVTARKQFPVLVDFVAGRVFAATTNAEEIGWVQAILKNLGAETFSLRWDFDDINWTSNFLCHVVKETKPSYAEAMRTRADELTRFSKKEVEKLEDKMMERVVSSFFAIAELETGDWAALKTAAKIRLHKPSDPITCAGPSEAFTVLGFSEEAFPAAATVVFQELTSKFKKETEYQVRNDKFTIQLDENINNQDAGVALLKGFDLPSFKREMMREIKHTKAELPIAQYWDNWLREMRAAVLNFTDNITETLKVDKTLGLKRFEFEAQEEEVAVQ
jgi:hypothetical protein